MKKGPVRRSKKYRSYPGGGLMSRGHHQLRSETIKINMNHQTVNSLGRNQVAQRLANWLLVANTKFIDISVFY